MHFRQIDMDKGQVAVGVKKNAFCYRLWKGFKTGDEWSKSSILSLLKNKNHIVNLCGIVPIKMIKG